MGFLTSLAALTIVPALAAAAYEPQPAHAMKRCLEGRKCDAKVDPCFAIQMARAQIRESAYRSDWLLSKAVLDALANDNKLDDLEKYTDRTFTEYGTQGLNRRVSELEELLRFSDMTASKTPAMDAARAAARADVEAKLAQLKNLAANRNPDGTELDEKVSKFEDKLGEEVNLAIATIEQMGLKLPAGGCANPPTLGTNEECKLVFKPAGNPTGRSGKSDGDVALGETAQDIWSSRDDAKSPLQRSEFKDVCEEFIFAALMHESTHVNTCKAAAKAKKSKAKTPGPRRAGRNVSRLPGKDADAKQGGAVDAALEWANDEADAYMNERAVLDALLHQSQDSCEDRKKKDPAQRTIRFEDEKGAYDNVLKNMKNYTGRSH
ncbi:MAG: hypothetical protein U0271_43410 [Polyangiaceae bacterium]